LVSGRGYVETFKPVVAYVGVNGVGPTREGRGRTPNGVFTLTQAFGNEANNGTKLPYFRAGPDDWWDENPASPDYNRHVVSAVSPGGDSENLYYAGNAYSHAVVINYNTNPVVKGAGSGFFLHVSFGAPTEGCVAVSAAELNWIMRWLDPTLHPVISIGVGTAALAVLHRAT
jgi:L,D-peptidoglycan transpeptidase YkuD (ErfK/YbiS/YcfS/YnhG family)